MRKAGENDAGVREIGLTIADIRTEADRRDVALRVLHEISVGERKKNRNG